MLTDFSEKKFAARFYCRFTMKLLKIPHTIKLPQQYRVKYFAAFLTKRWPAVQYFTPPCTAYILGR